MKLERARGTRDFLPEEKILREHVITLLKQTFERYGFSPMETPILERYDVLSSKYTGGDAILNETFTLNDQGKRNLGLRYDLTVPFARVVGMNPILKLPFKRYQIGDVFRDGPIKSGRYRQFTQCDVDIVGSKSMKADAEILAVARDFFTQLGVPFEIMINNRKILDSIMDTAKIEKDKRKQTIIILDKIKKAGKQQVTKELQELGLADTSIKQLLTVILVTGTNLQKINQLESQLENKEGLVEIKELLRYMNTCAFDPTLARGLSYYTGPIFEVFFPKSPVTSSVAAGGRYDTMVGDLLGRGDYPAVGISFGVDPLCDALQLAKSYDVKKTVIQVYVIPIKTYKHSLLLARKLRKEGVNTSVDLNERNISKNLDYADKLGVPFVVFIGEDEIKKKKYKLRDMKTGKEQFLTEPRLVKLLASVRF